MNREQLIEVIEASWRALDSALEGLDDRALEEPGVVEDWSVKDLIAHVAAWERRAIGTIASSRRGEPIVALSGVAIDSYNAEEWERNHDLSLAVVRSATASTRDELRALLAS